MGSRYSSGRSGLGSHGNRGQSGSGTQQEEDDEDEYEEVSQVVTFLFSRGQVQLVSGGGATGLQFVHSYSDSDDSNDGDGPWQGDRGGRYSPPVDSDPDTQDLDQSAIRTQILQATASSGSKGKQSFTRMLKEREQGRCLGTSFSHGECSQIRSHFLPNQVTHKKSYAQKVFCGVYSEDGDTFLSACKDQNIRLYDTSQGRFTHRHTVKVQDMGWSMLDACFTSDSRGVLYAGWSDCIHVSSPYNSTCQTHTALELKPDERRFCVYSVATSPDGKEVWGGAKDGCLYACDHELSKRTLKIYAHDGDVNTVTFADQSSQLLYSGGDDALCKVWDRRILREDKPEPVGQLAGHTDGITFIHSKGDARYLISNSKDQSIKLWDVRRFSPREGLEASRLAVTQQTWDYRWQLVPPPRALKRDKLTGDTSVMTYRGHGVLRTLIRCRFSPEFSTGQRFIYTGCSTGRVIIYDVLTGRVVSRLSGHKACVRDASWHPYQDCIISSSWDRAVCMWEHRKIPTMLDEERGIRHLRIRMREAN